MSDDRAIESFLERFHHLVERVQAVEEAPRRFGTPDPLSRAEIHTVSAIAADEGGRLSDLADRLEITKGAASQMVSRLVRKGLVEKRPSPDSGREIALRLTPAGQRAHVQHLHFHARMAAAVRQHYGADLQEGVTRARAALVDLIALVDTFARSADPD